MSTTLNPCTAPGLHEADFLINFPRLPQPEGSHHVLEGGLVNEPPPPRQYMTAFASAGSLPSGKTGYGGGFLGRSCSRSFIRKELS